MPGPQFPVHALVHPPVPHKALDNVQVSLAGSQNDGYVVATRSVIDEVRPSLLSEELDDITMAVLQSPKEHSKRITIKTVMVNFQHITACPFPQNLKNAQMPISSRNSKRCVVLEVVHWVHRRSDLPSVLNKTLDNLQISIACSNKEGKDASIPVTKRKLSVKFAIVDKIRSSLLSKEFDNVTTVLLECQQEGSALEFVIVCEPPQILHYVQVPCRSCNEKRRATAFLRLF
mmetsp:Transcript_8634/g.21267  ORF Transcript_8634/g.21267 Transcript_8634/m.21267 type:complete len:231 (+) Transcript_8634:748-1440(+)